MIKEFSKWLSWESPTHESSRNRIRLRVLAKAKKLEAEGRDIVRLEIGQPDFKTPRQNHEAAYRAMNVRYTCYSPTPGLPETREAIASYCAAHKKIKTNPNEVVVVPGGKPIMFFTMLSLINPGDEVIYPDPGFPIYRSCIRFAGGVPVPMPLLEKNDFSVDLELFKKSLTDKTKLVIINSPETPPAASSKKKTSWRSPSLSG